MRIVSTMHSPMTGFRTRGLLVAAASAVLLSGCGWHRDSVTVGAVPDDYRRNHPIMISEQPETLDIPVGVGEYRLTKVHKTALDGYVAAYDRSAAAPVSIMVPAGSANSAAASSIAHEAAQRLYGKGVPAGSVSILPYDAGAPEATPPIRLSYQRMKAHTGRCGRWTEDIVQTGENKHWANFGCSYQNNLAAQIANPADLLGPRAPGSIDAERRGVVIDGVDGQGGWRQEGSPDLSGGEIQYD